MKFLPSLSLLALVASGLAFGSCANPANRRELYNSSLADSGPWHDYERRREAESVTGVSGGTAPTVVPGSRGRPSVAPSSPLPAGTTAVPSAPAQVTESTSAGAPPVPSNPPAPAAVATPAPDAAAPAPVPVVPDAAATPAATPASP